jgi:hypothetical protein
MMVSAVLRPLSSILSASNMGSDLMFLRTLVILQLEAAESSHGGLASLRHSSEYPVPPNADDGPEPGQSAVHLSRSD